jgi:F-type H+-transporting ATPase subunit a
MFNTFESFVIPILVPSILVIISGGTLYQIIIGTSFVQLNKAVSRVYDKFILITRVSDNIYVFVLRIFEELGPKNYNNYFPVFLTLFTILLIGNILGLLPFAFSLTGHLVVTVTLAGTTFIAWVILGIIKSKFKFIFQFIPDNCPPIILPLMTVIELLSFLIRPISLSVRLFANILSGHILLSILSGSLYNCFKTENFVLITGFLVILSSFFILEVGIGGLQAYIFCLLSTIYFADCLSVHPIPSVFHVAIVKSKAIFANPRIQEPQ